MRAQSRRPRLRPSRSCSTLPVQCETGTGPNPVGWSVETPKRAVSRHTPPTKDVRGWRDEGGMTDSSGPCGQHLGTTLGVERSMYRLIRWGGASIPAEVSAVSHRTRRSKISTAGVRLAQTGPGPQRPNSLLVASVGRLLTIILDLRATFLDAEVYGIDRIEVLRVLTS